MVHVHWRAESWEAAVTPPARLTPRATFREPDDALAGQFDVPVVEIYALRFSDRFNEGTRRAEGIPHLARGITGEERIAALRASIEERVSQGLPPFTTPVEVGFGANKPGPYVKDGHHRLAIALELGIPTAPAEAARGVARALGWYDLGARRFAADVGLVGLNEYRLLRTGTGDPALPWIARWQPLPERLGNPVLPSVLLGRFATQRLGMHACELHANGLEAPRWWRENARVQPERDRVVHRRADDRGRGLER